MTQCFTYMCHRSVEPSQTRLIVAKFLGYNDVTILKRAKNQNPTHTLLMSPFCIICTRTSSNTNTIEVFASKCML